MQSPPLSEAEGMVQAANCFAGAASSELFSEQLSSNMAFKTINMDAVLEKAICLHHQERKHTMN